MSVSSSSLTNTMETKNFDSEAEWKSLNNPRVKRHIWESWLQYQNLSSTKVTFYDFASSLNVHEIFMAILFSLATKKWWFQCFCLILINENTRLISLDFGYKRVTLLISKEITVTRLRRWKICHSLLYISLTCQKLIIFPYIGNNSCWSLCIIVDGG